MDLLRKSNSTSQEHGKSEGHAQDLALEGFDTVIMRGREIGEVSNSFERPDTANVRIIVQMMGPNVSLEYRTTKLGHRQARSMAAAIETVISALVYEPSVTMGGLNWCDEEDANILDKWNSLDSTWIEECVHELIAKQATEQPHKSAVDAWDGHLTYRELDRLSSILASHLTLLGVAPETFVALCFEKSKWLVVSILAVIKAGGAYVVIEPYYPFSRMQDICTVLRINILLASRDLLHTATKLSDQVVVVEAGSECLKERHDEWQWEARSPCSPHNALYVVFSSGSTGKPKGIIVEHASFATWGTLLKQAVCLDADSRVLQFSSFAFLIAHRDVLLTLMFGGCVCMPSESQRLNHLETFIAKHRVNWANLTPSVAALLDPAMTPELKTLLLTSEPMSLKSLATWEGNVNLLFAYGQAESVSLCCVRNSPTVGSDRKNVGHRIGRSIWLVDPDDHNKLVPVGAVGELVIQGPVLARGYLDPETTALAFLRDTAWLRQLRPRYQGKLYKTGDLAQFTDDGSVRYIGRKDNSAKLHGQRLDLDLVLQHVQRCLVEMSDTEVCNMVIDLSYSPHFEDVKLTAFLGFSPTSTDTEDSVMLGPLNRAAAYLHDFQSRLVNVIPRHMIPTLVVIVSHIPLNLSGKIDRRKLREILSQMTASEVALCLGSIASHEAPCTDRELKLRSLWSQALNTVESNIGRLDDFFRRGGDSLAAMRLASAAHALGLDLTFGDIFANPVLSNQAEHIGSDKRQTNRDYSCGDFELITQAQKQAIIVAAAADHALSASQIKDIYPTTPMQQGLIALDALRPGSYLSQRVYQIKTGVSLRKLESAWGAVMDANPPLRTRVIRRADDGLTYQVVIRGQTKLHMAHNLPKYLADDEAKPMGLGEPLLRLAIVSNTNGEPTHCVVTIHHCIYDAWSMAILLDQVSDAYHDRALVARNFRHFVKYVCESNANSSEYWRSETNGVVAEQFPALPAPSYSLNTAEREILNTTLSQSVAAAANITLATRIQLAWAMTIAAYTGVDDVVYGLTVSGRASPVQGIDKMAGPTIATFPLRVQLRSSSSIHQELDMLQRRVIATIPFEQFGLQNISRLGDDAARACKFQSLLVIQQSQSAAETKSDILTDVEDSAVRPRWNTYALSLLCTPFRGGAVRFEAVYDATVVPKAQMRRILQVFVNILKQVTVSPDRLVGDVDSISAQDLEQIQRWNPSLQQAVPKCVHAMIHDQCVSQPNAIAVDAWDGQLSYKELEEQSSLLSMSLKEKGLGHDMFVPLCFEKSKWVAVGILAVLKAGSAFILLDPSHPAERLARICENSQATAVLCSRNTVGLAAKLSCPHVIQVDEKLSREHQVAPAAQALQPTKTLPSHALCALYTSGSTGTPKGIIIEHSAVATQVTALESHFHLDRQSRIFQFASHAFDVAVSDYLFALALGGCVCVPKETDSRDNLARAIRGCRANWVFLTPSVARSLQPSAVPEIETMVIGGESAKRLDFATWSSAVRLIYVYGPAEGTVFCTLQTKTSSGADPINIGSAVAAACWLVDCANSEKLVAIGAVGELMIEGPIVGRGYIGNDSSGSSFISAPKWLRNLRRSESPSRLYKTGDLMRYSPVGDGSLEFVGRKDRQAKLRGQRMELAEIEHQVSQHFPGATDAVVEIIAPPESDSQKLLAAFVWDATSAAEPLFDRGPGTSSKPSIFSLPDAEFQSRASIAEVELRKRLPPFMIPSLFIPLNELPFGPTGKADRRLIKSEASSLSRQELSVYHSSESTTTVPLAAALKLAWGSVVSAFTGEADAIFGTVVSGRMASLRNIHKIAGPTIATVPFRVRQVPAMTIQDALDEVQSRSLRMIRYEQTGLQRLRQLGFAEACQFQSLLIVQFSEEGDIVESPLYKVVLEEPGGTFQTYPLTIVCTPSAKSVHIRATFDSELMSAALVNRLLTQFSAAVAHITNLPRKCMSSIPSLSIGDAKKIWMWNRSVPQRENSCIHDIITKNAAARRETPAVCAWDGGFTYDELEDLSSKLAKRLQGFGVATGSMVPLCFEKSRWTVVAMLAVLKAGYTFVPLDVSQAAGRRDVILARIRADIILASAKCAELLAATKRVVLVVDEVSLEALPPRPPAGALLSREATERPGTSAAYVLFTSGSTGQPKGVVVDHSALSTSCLAHGSRMGFSERTRMLQFTSHTFDISLAEIFTTLIFGGCVCIPSEDDRFSGLELSVDAMKVNTVCLTASVARLVEPHRMPSLDTIIFVGENATEDDFKKWMHLSQVFDAYGPTECTIFCSINRVQTSSGAGSVIGEAVGSVSWVVSPGNHDHLLPIGAVGELLVEGPVLARGYLDDAGKTSAVFIEDPSWLVQGTEGYAGRRGRLYKTGDLVHYNEDGSLTYCGRKDTQVKIRGHRVELEEVECHLRNCVAGAHQAAVVSVALSIDDCASRLTAFLCFDAEASPPEDQVHAVTLSLPVRDNLADHLPAYMVPSAYLAIRRLPLNTAGKLDRRRLREIVVNYFERRGAKSDTVPKQGCSKEESVWLHRNAVGGAVFSPLPSPFRDCSTETERRVRSAWAAVLGLPNDRISTDDNFYDIGGDSIRVIRLMKVIENEFGVRLWSSLVNSRKTTISKMAEYIETRPEMDSIDLEGDIAAALGSPWASAVSEPWFSPVGSLSGPATVFLTGGTGFLGTHILRNLLTSTTVARVAVLVRAASAVEGMERVKKTALMAEWWKAEHERRIDVWIGDLELRRLGLGESQWSRLSGTAAAGNISTIIHSGAVVNWNMDYDRLRSPNVLSTVELLRAAALSHAAPRFVFVSGGAMAELDVNPGDTAAMEQLSRSSGYAQSKFAAEAITRRFAARLPPSQNRFSVVKPGMIIGPADTGVANLDDFLWRVVAAASRLRLYPVDDEEEDSWVSVTDADFVATQVVAQVLPADRGHVAPYVAVASRHGLGAADFWAQVNAELKHACEPVSWPAWVERALQQTRHVGESHPLWPVQEFLVAAGKGKKHGGGGISTASPLVAPDKAVLCEAVRANLRHLGRVGFVETRQSSLSTTRHGVFRRSAAAPASCS
ncbi:Acetyl-CoA synthetase-like protein [Cordyceps javanica]|nr:Acetyl-CoA synthetase-like protein [Cordyceps javanica]